MDGGSYSDPASDWDLSGDEEEEQPGAALAGPSPSLAADAGPSRAGWTSHFVAMGFSEVSVAEAIKQNSEGDADGVLETLLTAGNTRNVSEKDKIISSLVEMGFPAEEASLAIDRCGPDASISELADSICASQMAEESDCEDVEQFDDSDEDIEEQWESSTSSSSSDDETYQYISPKRKKSSSESSRPEKRVRICEKKTEFLKKWKKLNDHEDTGPVAIPELMTGFGLPFDQPSCSHRKLPDAAVGPPFFYYEDIANAPKGLWEKMSRFLYDIEPEFVDSKYFSAISKKSGYLHNLPIENRLPLLPVPPKTIHEAFPSTRKWWPSWDTRTHLNSFMTTLSNANTTKRIQTMLAQSEEPPPQRVRDYVLEQCSACNLIWIGLHKVVPLEPEEMEMVLGFPRSHTRGMSWRKRHAALANSFQVDTVAFHLSVLKHRFPNGVTVLSLFSGIGGAEMALHRLGIRLKTVVSVEPSDANRNIIRRWWEETEQQGSLIEISDAQQLDGNRLEQLINACGGFDLVIGRNPDKNLAGKSQKNVYRLGEEHSTLFYDYFRVLELVKCTMVKS